METTLQIEGMTCASCVARVEKVLLRQPGVVSAQVNLASEAARVVADNQVRIDTLIAAVEAAGYRASLARQDQAGAAQQFWPLGLGLALCIPLILPMLIAPFGLHWRLAPWLQFALAAPIQFVLGARFYRGAWVALLDRAGTMDQLVVLGTSAAFLLSMYQWLVHSQTHLYFESAAVVVTLVRLGKYLETLAKRQANQAVRALMALRAPVARVRRGVGNSTLEADVQVDQVVPGDVVLVRAGERVPVDALVIEGVSLVDESMLTGEPMPVTKEPGDAVSGGSLNNDGLLITRASRRAADSTLAGIIRAVERAQAAKPPIQLLVDRVATVFVPTIVLFALLTMVGWALFTSAGMSNAILNGVAVLVIACPCALGLATPAAIIAGTGAAARAGILIKDAGALEVATHIRIVAFDKTGTLTEGRPRVAAVETATGMSLEEAVGIAAALASGSTHPLAQAVARYAEPLGIAPVPVHDIRTLPGRGVEARDANGALVVFGQAQWISSLGAAVSVDADVRTTSLLARDRGEGTQVLAHFRFTDQARATGPEAISRLHALGLKCAMLTGDKESTAGQVADSLEIDEIRAHLQPEAKTEALGALRALHGAIAMVGDGINDAPALAAADVSIAIGGGTDVALETASITLMRPDLRLVPAALEIAARTHAKIRQNLFFAFFYNVLGIPLAALGLLNPAVAGLAMAMSSVSVVANALWLARWKPDFDTAEPAAKHQSV